MSKRDFRVIEDPDRPGRLLYSREGYEIVRSLQKRERDCWLRFFALQVIYGSLVWWFLFS
jgi:hypothetical protein